MTEDVAFEVRDATVRFEMDRGVARVLDAVDVTVRREEILGLVGESGSGKSMLVSSMIDAIEDPGVLTGEITYYPRDGDPVSVLDLSAEQLRRFRWSEVSMVFQGALDSFNPTLTIRQHFLETLSAHDANRDAGMDRARDLLEDLYLEPEGVFDAYPHELSGGMKQRALIALSLVLEPEVLIMDEPTGALDLLMQRSILSLIKDIQETRDLTIVFISHDLPLVSNLADRIGVMYAFDLVEIGTAADIIENPRHPYTRALLKAVPDLRTPFDAMRPIAGESPDAVAVPAGCSYHPRCELADETCRTDPPPFEEITDEHRARCFYTEDAPSAVPLNTGTGPETPADGGAGAGDPAKSGEEGSR